MTTEWRKLWLAWISTDNAAFVIISPSYLAQKVLRTPVIMMSGNHFNKYKQLTYAPCQLLVERVQPSFQSAIRALCAFRGPYLIVMDVLCMLFRQISLKSRPTSFSELSLFAMVAGCHTLLVTAPDHSRPQLIHNSPV